MSNDNREQLRAWHEEDGAAVCKLLETSTDGLTPAQAQRRLDSLGYNRLPMPPKRTCCQRFIEQFNNVLIYILLVAGSLTAFLGHWVDTGVILAVVLINALIGVIQEGKAEKALDAIREMLSHQATVLRGGSRTKIDAEQLVPGDVVFLHPGDKVPADLRLISLKSLQIQESVLTGESYAVSKHLDAVSKDAALGDRKCMAYSSTLVTYGRGTGVVVGTGEDTEIGRISHLLAEEGSFQTPLLRQLSAFGRWLTLGIVVLALFTFSYGYFVSDKTFTDMFLAAVGLAVAAIPEGLPAILTITLAIGVSRMAKRNAIIRRLPAVEAMGSVTVICTDKTGTLTCNELAVQNIVTSDRHYTVSGRGLDPVGNLYYKDKTVRFDDTRNLDLALCAGSLCNDAALNKENGSWVCHGNPMDCALLSLGLKAEINLEFEEQRLPRSDLIPFESEHKFMATLRHDHKGQVFIHVKGAPEQILAMCDTQFCNDEFLPLDKNYWHDEIEKLAADGQRVIAIAFKRPAVSMSTLKFEDVESGCVMLALFGVADPARPEASEAVAQCKQAGMKIKMITGDHLLTAKSMARDVGINKDGRVLTGPEIDEMDDGALASQIEAVDIFARTTPEHKLRIVKALEANNEVVAMTGDGVNDAPALKHAAVGVAMGKRGTEATKEVAEMVLADDNFATISAAVEEGRTVYDNIKKTILFILPTNGGQAFTIVLAVLFGLMLPIMPVQILWVNMVTAVTLALALAFEPVEADVMRRPPRPPDEPIFTPFLIWRIVFVSSLLVMATFGLFFYERLGGCPISTARTVAVNMLVAGEVVYVISCRRTLAPGFTFEGLFGSKIVLFAILLVVILQLLYTYLPLMQFFFSTTDLTINHWKTIGILALAIFVIVEFEKFIIRRFNLLSGFNHNRI
jgi:magnesium-transporting ATPase (P-type)